MEVIFTFNLLAPNLGWEENALVSLEESKLTDDEYSI